MGRGNILDRVFFPHYMGVREAEVAVAALVEDVVVLEFRERRE